MDWDFGSHRTTAWQEWLLVPQGMAEPVAGRVCHYGSAGEPHLAPFARGPLPAGVAQGAHKDVVFWVRGDVRVGLPV